MDFNKMLYPTDFSGPSSEALAFATSLARDNAAELLICHVFEPPVPVQGMVKAPTITAATADEQRERLHSIRPLDPAVKFEHRMVDGLPSHGIIALAETEGIDLIVMSTHGHSGLKRLILGSVAESVIRDAPCPVLTLKQPDPKQSDGAS